MLAVPDTAPAAPVTHADALPTELPDLATRKPKPPAKPAPPTKLLIGTEGSIVYAGFNEDLACWQYSCIGPNGITATYGSAQAAKTAYRALPKNTGV